MLKAEKNELHEVLSRAVNEQDTNKQSELMTEYFNLLGEHIKEDVSSKLNGEIESYNNKMRDTNILSNREFGLVLTNEEMKYFNAVVEKKGFDNVEQVFPKTIVQYIFDDLSHNHPLLSRVDTMYTEALVEFVYAKPNTARGYWGPICEDIRQLILNGFESVSYKHNKLSGFVVVCKGMLELGPEFLARYVMQAIRDIFEVTLVEAIISGNGKNQPVGMVKKLTGVIDGEFKDKDKVAVTKFDASTFGAIHAALAESKVTGNPCLIMSEVTYWSKIFPAFAVQNPNGVWNVDTIPTGEAVILENAVPKDVIIYGDPKNYALMVSGEFRINRYDQTLAIEDLELFIGKMFCHGVPKDKNAFIVLDVSGIAAPATNVPVDKDDVKSGRLNGDLFPTGQGANTVPKA